MSIIGILAAVGAAGFGGIGSSRGAMAAQTLARDIDFAREKAVQSGWGALISFDQPASTYSLLADNPASPGRAGATPITDPSGPGAFSIVVSTDFPGVSIVSVSIPGGGADLGFDWRGRPLDSSGALLTAASTIELSNAHSVRIEARTGLASTD